MTIPAMMVYVASTDLLVAQAIFAARLFEAATSDSGPWYITWGPHRVEATRMETEEGVVFEAVFPEACYIERPDPNATLWCRDRLMAIRAIDFPGDAKFVVTWELSAARRLAHDG